MERLTSSFVLSLNCTICKKECKSYADWISHLVENEHQNFARTECRKWDDKVKECVIVAYADFPVVTLGKKFAQVFGCLSRGRFVTDFVTWEHRPRVAFIQFESRKKAWEVISKTGKMSQLKIQNQRIQVKKAIDVMELEWDEFFPPPKEPITCIQFKDKSVQTGTLSIFNPCQKWKFDCINNPEEKTKNHLPCSLKILSQEDSFTTSYSNPNLMTSSRVPSSLQIVSQEENHMPSSSKLPLASPKLDTSNHSSAAEDEVKNVTPMQPLLMSVEEDPNDSIPENRSENHATSLLLLSNEETSNTLEDNSQNQVPSLQTLSQKDSSNNSTHENGTKKYESASSSSSTLLLPCEKKNVSSNPIPGKELSKQENNSNAGKGKGNNNRLPSIILELSLKKPPELKQNNAKRRRLITADVQTIITTPNSYQMQFKEICHEIMFPDLEYNNAVSIVKSMELSVQETYPKSNLYVFRNMYLKLKNPGNNKLLIFLDTQGIWEDNWILDTTFKSQNIPFVVPNLMKPVTEFWLKLKLQKLPDMESIKQDFISELNSFGMEFYHEASDLSLTLVTRQHFILEVQSCRLLNYMTAFDPRTIYVMAIVKYWAHVNQFIPLSPEITDREAQTSMLNQAISLEWLIIVFLSSKRFIPTVRQILERPHKKLVMFKEDIGFDDDMIFAKAWAAKRGVPGEGSEGFIESVLALVQEFFKFFDKLPNTPFVLNTRDGEIIKSEQFARESPYCQSAVSGVIFTNLSKEELTTIKSMNAQVGKPFVSMLHPLCLGHMLAFEKSTFYGKSKIMIKDISEKLQNVTFYGSHTKNNIVDLKSLLLY